MATRDATRIAYHELARGVTRVLDRVVRGHEIVVVERGGSAVAVITPAPADHEAFLATAGACRDLVDTEQLKADIAASRRHSSRPPVEL